LELEIEKKIILKELPPIQYDNEIKITQYYFKNEDDQWERYRKSESDNGIEYFKTIKKTLRKGVSMEDESNITQEEFKGKVKLCDRKISKTRYIKTTIDNLFWEVDVFDDIDMVMAEIEIPTEDYEVKYPKWIKGFIVEDVTGNKDFSNRRMAKEINYN